MHFIPRFQVIAEVKLMRRQKCTFEAPVENAVASVSAGGPWGPKGEVPSPVYFPLRLDRPIVATWTSP